MKPIRARARMNVSSKTPPPSPPPPPTTVSGGCLATVRGQHDPRSKGYPCFPLSPPRNPWGQAPPCSRGGIVRRAGRCVHAGDPDRCGPPGARGRCRDRRPGGAGALRCSGARGCSDACSPAQRFEEHRPPDAHGRHARHPHGGDVPVPRGGLHRLVGGAIMKQPFSASGASALPSWRKSLGGSDRPTVYVPAVFGPFRCPDRGIAHPPVAGAGGSR